MAVTESDRDVRCPFCGESMRVEHRRGVEIDVCDEHGIWLDRGELERILERAQASEDSPEPAAPSRATASARRPPPAAGSSWWAYLIDFAAAVTVDAVLD